MRERCTSIIEKKTIKIIVSLHPSFVFFVIHVYFSMADRLATPLGIKSEILVFEELLVAQDDIRSIGKSVDTLLMELDQQALEAYLSSASEGSATGRARRTSKTGSPKLSPEHAANTSSAK